MSINDGNIVLGPGEGKIIPVPGHKVTHKVVGADTDGAYSLLEVELVGDGPPHDADESGLDLRSQIQGAAFRGGPIAVKEARVNPSPLHSFQ